MTSPTATLVIVALTAATLGACATAEPTATTSVASTSAATTDTTTVAISRSRFGTPELRVAPGTTVTFRNDDAYAHTVTSAEGAPVSFDSGELLEGATFSIVFDEPGAHHYFCRIHPTMRAVVLVG